METFKKIMLWVAIIVIVFFVTNFCNFYIMASTYKDIDCKITNSNNIDKLKRLYCLVKNYERSKPL